MFRQADVHGASNVGDNGEHDDSIRQTRQKGFPIAFVNNNQASLRVIMCAQFVSITAWQAQVRV